MRLGPSACHEGSVQHVTDITRNDGLSTTAREGATKVFFSHSSKDRAWVEETVERLEQNHSIECLFDERDFIGGRPIVDNIIRCIRNTDRTVLVLTPDFLDSPWCGYEAQVIFNEHLCREQKVMIPVLLSECIVPDFIKHLTYLDVRDPQFWEKFLERITSGNITDEIVQESLSEIDTYNGKTIIRIDKNSKFDSNSIYELLIAKGIRVPRENINAAAQSLLTSFPVQHDSCYGCCGSFVTKVILWTVFGFLTLGTFAMFLALMESILSVYDSTTDKINNAFGLMLSMFGSFAAITCLMKCRRIHRTSERQANMHLIDHGLIVGIARSDKRSANFGIYFVYFQTSRCLHTLERYLRDKARHSTPRINAGRNSSEQCLQEVGDDGSNEERELIEPTTLHDFDEKIQESAREYLVSVCGRYVRMVNENQSYKSPTGFRHSRTGICLCQLVQQNCFHELV
ncbi:uncharacterized protein LOC144347807 [Saccoglossus kowalevskii]